MMADVMTALSGDSFWWGLLIGVALAMAVVIATAAWLSKAPGVSQAQHRADARDRVWRDWCARNEWCPVHDLPDGECPPVEVAVNGWSRGLGMCAGSASIHRSEALQARSPHAPGTGRRP